MIYSDDAKLATACQYIDQDYKDKSFRAKFQIEYYFGEVNYPKDQYLLSCRDEDGWVTIDEL